VACVFTEYIRLLVIIFFSLLFFNSPFSLLSEKAPKEKSRSLSLCFQLLVVSIIELLGFSPKKGFGVIRLVVFCIPSGMYQRLLCPHEIKDN